METREDSTPSILLCYMLRDMLQTLRMDIHMDKEIFELKYHHIPSKPSVWDKKWRSNQQSRGICVDTVVFPYSYLQIKVEKKKNKIKKQKNI